MRFSLKLLHDLNTNTTHSPAQVLDNVKAIEDDFRRRQELSGDVVIGTEHVHGNDLDAVSDLSGMAEKVIAVRPSRIETTLSESKSCAMKLISICRLKQSLP